MHSSVEVLRILPLGGIAPIGRGGGTGQQGSPEQPKTNQRRITEPAEAIF